MVKTEAPRQVNGNKLAKDLTWLAVLALGLSGEVGAGIFYVSAQVQGIVPGVGPNVPLALIVDGLVAAFLAITYWYFSSSIAGAGGEYLFVSRTLGARFGFIVHLIAWLGGTASVGFLAHTAPSFLASALNLLSPGSGHWFATNIGSFVTGVVLIWLAWWVHVRGIKHVGTALQVAMWVILASGFLVMVMGFTHTPAMLNAALLAKTHLSAASLMAAGAKSTPTSLAFFEALPVLYFAYAGLRGATYAGGETNSAKKVVGKSILGLLVLVAVYYVTFAFALYHVAPWQLVAGLIKTHHGSMASASALVGLLLPQWLGVTLNFAVALIVFKTILPGMMTQSRLLLSFAADGILPSSLAKLTPQQTPIVALTIGASLSTIVLVETALTGSAFGLASGVLASTLVHAALGIGMILMPYRAPDLFAANTTWIKEHRIIQWFVGLMMVLIALSLAYLVVLPSLGAYWLFNPLVQVILFSIFGSVLYQLYWRKVVASGGQKEHDERFRSEPSL